MSVSDIQTELNTIKNEILITKSNTGSTGSTGSTDSTDSTVKNTNSIENIESFINNKVANIYARSWSKLEARLKKKKIKEYLDYQLNNNSINKEVYQETLNLYNKNIDLNRKFKVDYDIDNCEIISIK